MAIYPKELTDLIESYLTDGIITMKEREVLLKKAEQLGLNVDEVDLYIDAQQQKSDQLVDAATKKKRGKTCPFCGGSIPQLADICPHCNRTITPEASEELEKLLEQLENALVDFKSGKDVDKNKAVVEGYIRKAKVYYENNPKVLNLIAEVEKESQKASEVANREKFKKSIVQFIKNHKILSGCLIYILLGIIGGILTIGDTSHDPTATLENVNEALEEDNVKEAIEICMPFYDSHDYSADALEEIMPAYNAIIKYQTKELTNLINSDDLAEAQTYLDELTILPGMDKMGKVLEKYDIMFLKVINACIKNEDYDSAESVGLTWRAKLNNENDWLNSSCYKKLKSTFENIERDFSALE